MIWLALIGWSICALVTAIIAGSRDRNPISWLAIGAVIGIFGLILVLALPPARPAPASSSYHPLIGAGRKIDGAAIDCPDCGEPVAITDRTCSHCGMRIA